MTIQEARAKILNELKDIYDKSEAMNIAALILEKISGYERPGPIMHKELFLTPEQTEELKKILARLRQHEPVQYALEEAWFAGMKFKVNKNVLIPRPETEELLDWVIEEVRCTMYAINFNKEEVGHRTSDIVHVLDIGTGSGCIPIAIKKKLPEAKVLAIDVSGEALLLAKENALALEADIEFILLNFLDEKKWNELGKYDVIVSNPPYITQMEKETMHRRVTAHEPELALFVPDNDALLFYRKLADFSMSHLSPGGNLFVEINESMGKEVVELFQTKGLKSVDLKKDMQGKERMVRAVLSSES
jgi:release factor glutamine methyltransferase